MSECARPGAPGASRAAPAALVAAVAAGLGFEYLASCARVLPFVVLGAALATLPAAWPARARGEAGTAAGAARSLGALLALALACVAWGGSVRARDGTRAVAPGVERRGWVVGRVRGLAETGGGDVRFRLAVERSDLGLARRAELAVRARGGRVPTDGERVAFLAGVRGGAPATNPGGFDDARALRVARLAGRAEVFGTSLRVLAPPSPWDFSARAVSPLRARLLSSVRAQERGKAGAFLAGFLLGDRSAIAPEDVDDLRRIGALHLLAISGMHVVLAVALLGRLTRLAGLRGRRAALVRWLGVVGYSALAGGSASVWRAGVSSALVETGALVGRRVRGEQALALAVLGLTLVRPTSPLDAGFQLSVLATWGLLALAQPLQRIALAAIDARLAGRSAVARAARAAARPALDAIVPTLGAQLAALPCLAAQFGAVSGLGLLSNLLLVPITNLALVAGLVALATGDVFPAWARLVWPVADVCALATLRAAEVLALAPAALRPLADPPWAIVALGSALIVFGWPPLFRAVCARAAFAPLVAGVGLGAAIAILVPTAPAPRGVFRWTMLDVGQGDAHLLEFPDGRRWLVDAGDAVPGRDQGTRVVLPALRRRGITRLDALLVTHADRDHAGGAPAVLRDVPCARVLAPDDVTTALRTRARRRGGAAGEPRWQAVVLGDTLLNAPQARVIALWPPAHFRSDARWSTNRSSIVLRVELMARDTLAFLLTGDADTLVERALVARGLPHCAILKVGHHGSRTSSGGLVLDALAPRLALASVGRVNRFGHPHQDVVARIRDRGIAWRSTAEEGALEVEAWTDGAGRWRWRVTPARSARAPHAPPEAQSAASAPCQAGLPGGNVRRE